MELFSNPWFILFTALNIVALIYLAIKFYYKNKEEPLLFDRLKDADVHITIRTPPKPSGLKEGNTKENSD
ncbi:MAG: hypothetical protein K8S18_21750 [Desulfobacula sp.]|nr:hypothetical protein [Desulfobacula sp.]